MGSFRSDKSDFSTEPMITDNTDEWDDVMEKTIVADALSTSFVEEDVGVDDAAASELEIIMGYLVCISISRDFVISFISQRLDVLPETTSIVEVVHPQLVYLVEDSDGSDDLPPRVHFPVRFYRLKF